MPFPPCEVKRKTLRVGSKTPTGGYVLEIAIPLSSLPALKPAGGRLIGLDVALDDNDSDNPADIRKIQMTWGGRCKQRHKPQPFRLPPV